MTSSEVYELAKSFPESVLIGGVNDREKLFPALISFDKESGRFIYEYHRLVECFMLMNKSSIEDATEWVDFNVLRSIPYQGEYKPRVIIKDEESDIFRDACTMDPVQFHCSLA